MPGAIGTIKVPERQINASSYNSLRFGGGLFSTAVRRNISPAVRTKPEPHILKPKRKLSRAEAGENIVDTFKSLRTSEADEDGATDTKIKALAK